MAGIIKVIFNGYDLSKILLVNSLKRGIQIGRRQHFRNRNNQKGVDRLGYTSELVSIEMDFTFIYDVSSKRKQLAEILNVTEPKPLTFNDEPDKTYYALPKSNISIGEDSSTGEGTIIWQIPDGVAYSIPEYEFSNDFKDYILIDNPGTEDMELELQANFTSDNGFLGLQSDTGDVRALFGKTEEIDGFNYEVSEKLFNDHFNVPRGWVLNEGVVPPVVGNEVQQGTFSYKQESANEGFAHPSNYGTPTTAWSGPSLTKIIPTDSNGEYPKSWSSAFRVDFNTDGSGSGRAANVGHQSITFADQNNDIILSIVIEDNTPTAQLSDLAIYIRNKRVYDSRKTTSYYVTARPGESNHIHVSKIGNKINVELAFIGQKLSFNLNEENIELRKVTFYAARYKSLAPIQNNLIRALNVVKHNVTKWEDVPNKFMAGDELIYGKNERNIFCYLNEMNALELRDVGSTLITAPPGLSVLHLAYSTFSETPLVTLRGRARYTI